MISVVIPCARMAHFLPDAIGSVMRQDVPVAEILVVDAGPSAETQAVCAGLAASGAPLRVIEAAPCHPGVARNLALAEARGEIIAFLDADDLWPAGKLARQCARLDATPGVGMVSGHVAYFDRLDPARLAPAADARVETVLHVHLGACLYRREVLTRLGGFDPGLRYSEDVDLLLRLREAAIPFTILRATTLYYRRHAGQMMQAADPRREGDFRRALTLSLARRRRLGLRGELPPLESHLEPKRLAA
ncbi:MAG: glycosyltransferase family 2 protein [Proteobacteria bacterium]|nr:glycosyltransferase family 2 protein [Pseudomonadota bacterium]